MKHFCHFPPKIGQPIWAWSNCFSLLVPLWLPWCLASEYSLMGEELGHKLQILYSQATECFYSLSLEFSRAVSKSWLHPRFYQTSSLLHSCCPLVRTLGVHFAIIIIIIIFIINTIVIIKHYYYYCHYYIQ